MKQKPTTRGAHVRFKSGFPKLPHTTRARLFYEQREGRRESERRGGCSGNLLLDTPAKIVLESAFYDAPASALAMRQQNVLMCEIRRHWRLFAVASRANSSGRLKVCNAICWLFRFAAWAKWKSICCCCWGCGPLTHAKLTIAKCKMC